ncbi:putative leader peptide [Streptomyces albidochromogenes]|uniref:Leader peptide n=1 Tax=Streptomyces albidochromogenes TaxID=329524 RepID=A0ABW6FGD8_9ACTN
MSLATSSPGAQTPKTPQASWGPFSPGSRSWLSRPSPRGTPPSVGEIDHWSELGIRASAPPGCPALDRCVVPPSGSRLLRPRGSLPVPLVERRHVDLVRVASAICRRAWARTPPRPVVHLPFSRCLTRTPLCPGRALNRATGGPGRCAFHHWRPCGLARPEAVPAS